MATESEPHEAVGTTTERARARVNGEVPVCRRCGVEVPAANVTACRNCGFDPVALHRGKMRLWGVVSGLLVMSVVGIPFALLTGFAALKHRRELKKGVVG